MDQQDVNVLALVKGKERYVFMYNEKNREVLLETFARYASDPELNFTWYDAAALSQRVRNERRKAEIEAARKANRARLNREGTEQDDNSSQTDAKSSNFFNYLEN